MANQETDRRITIDVSFIDRGNFDINLLAMGGGLIRSYTNERMIDVLAILSQEMLELRGVQSEEPDQEEKKPFTCKDDEFLEFLANQEGDNV